MVTILAGCGKGMVIHMTGIKICGLTRGEEVTWILEEEVDYFGIVLFFPKSRRNVSIEKAKELLAVRNRNGGAFAKDGQMSLNGSQSSARAETGFPKAVAVTVSPTASQIKEIEDAGFDMIQIHGELSKEAFDAIHLPIIRAFNVTDMEAYEKYHNCPKVAAYLFDAKIPGSGQVFDWNLLKKIPRDEKLLILAGGLNSENVQEAIRQVQPDVVDVSSGVEIPCKEETQAAPGGGKARCGQNGMPEGNGNIAKKCTVSKDREKIKEFVRKAVTDEQ